MRRQNREVNDMDNEYTEYFDLNDLSCPECKTPFSEYTKTSLLGCAHCYKYFRELIIPAIKKYQFNLQHVGKYPVNTSVEANSRKRLNLLEKELHEEVLKENFEKAAILRDEIIDLKKELEEEIK